MKGVRDILLDSNVLLNYISFFLFVIMLQGCFGCNKCNHNESKPEKPKTEFNFSEWWNESKYK